ncbi:MAG: hypothetical protein HY878_06185, partial [Deltaproteobacteria bacterium]|nr:hypothetical protein [Deltaproteobacteria bacterium]
MEVVFSPQTNPFHNALEAISSLRSGEGSTLSGLFGSSKAFFIASFFQRIKKSLLVVTPTQEDAEGFEKDLAFFLGEDNVLLYPSWEVLPFEAQSPHPDIEAKRIEVLYKLLKGQPLVVVTTPPALMQRVIPRDVLESSVEYLEAGKIVNRDWLIEGLLNKGYARMALVEERGEISVRGGILDIFPPIYPSPIRLEFFGDEIDSIRFFVPVTQRSKGEILPPFAKGGEGGITILPAREMSFDEERRESALEGLKVRADELYLPNTTIEDLSERIMGRLVFSGMEFLLPLFYPSFDTIFEYLPQDAILFIDEPSRMEEEVDRFGLEIQEMTTRLKARRQFFVRPEDLYLSNEGFLSHLKTLGGVSLYSLEIPETLQIPTKSNLDIRQDIAMRKEELLKPLVDRVKDWSATGWRIFFVTHTVGQAERLRELLEGYCLPLAIRPGKVDTTLWFTPSPGPTTPQIILGELTAGFRIPSMNLVIITEEDIFGEKVKRRPPTPRKEEAFLTRLRDLDVGDLVVHNEHGIGVYQGLKKLQIEGIENDFLFLEYQGGDRLYLPVHRLNLVSKYAGVEGRHLS